MAATTYTVREALRRASVLLMDSKPQFKRWSEAVLVDFLNDGQAAIAKYIPTACSRMDAIKLRAGALQSLEQIAAADCKPQDGSVPAAPIIGNSLLKLVCNMGADGATVGRALRLIDQAKLVEVDPLWMTTAKANATLREYSFDPENPRLFFVNPPVPAASTVWVLASYTAQPVKVADGGVAGSERYVPSGAGENDKLTIADVFLDDLVNYVVARANFMANEWADGQKGVAFATMFVQSINAQATALTGVNPNLQRLPFAPTPAGAAK